jgi:hypothetical protein
VTAIVFKEFLPDQPDLGNPGLLDAANVIPNVDGSYMPYVPLSAGASATLSSTPNSAFPYATTAGGTAGGFQELGIVVGTPTDILRLASSTFNSIRSATYGGVVSANSQFNFWSFTQYENVIVAANKIDAVQQWTIGAAAATALSAAAPIAQQVGVVGQFLVLGNLATPSNTGFHSVQWSGIDAINSFPTPNSATAIAQQSGIQTLPVSAGTVTGISGGDQVAVIFQRAAVTRMTYVGPPAVFQFDTIDPGRGCFYPNSVVRVGRETYYASGLGFFVTDGVNIVPIGDAQVNKFFADYISGENPSTAVYGAVDYDTRCVMWSLKGQRILHYNYEAKRWSYAAESTRVLISGIQSS